MAGSRNTSFSVQQTQKSFSTISGLNCRAAAACTNAVRRSSGFNWMNLSMDYFGWASRRRMSPIHAGA
jgi:hypothetical protein